jgi:hypothetical protein
MWFLLECNGVQARCIGYDILSDALKKKDEGNEGTN